MPGSSDGLSAKAQAALALPEGFKTYSPFPFGGLNLKASPIAVDDKEFTWVENFIKTGDGGYRTLWDVGSPIYSAPAGLAIVYYNFYTIATNYYCCAFLSDGSAVQIDRVSLAQVQIGPPFTFYNGSNNLPYVRQWGSQYLLICNRNTPNDYWQWDGALLYGAGTVAPNGVEILSGGANYQSVPTVTAYGGQGSGLVIVPSISGGSIVELNITNPGQNYEIGDQIQLEFSGGGGDNSAVLTANLKPVGVAGVTITAPGSGYTTASVSFTVGVALVNVTAEGSGYTNATVAFSGGGGSGAAATAQIVNGISSITLDTPGLYKDGIGPPVVITGDGIGAAAHVVMYGDRIQSIVVTNPGSGYTHASVNLHNSFAEPQGTATANISGVIQAITVTSTGSGYTSAPAVTITGDGTGAAATAVLSGSSTGGGGSGATGVVVIENGVASVSVTAGGMNYTTALVAFLGGGGTGATAEAQLATGVTSISVTAMGTGYATAPTVTITGDGQGATATATVSSGAVTSIAVNSQGTGYTTTTVTITGGGGTGATATAAISGYVQYILIDDNGINYTSAPTVQVFGDGTGATGTAVLSGTISGVNITNAGSGYTTAPTATITGDGQGARAIALLQSSSVASVDVVNPGTGFTEVPLIQFIGGNGAGAVGVVKLTGTTISQVNVVNQGSGYTSTPTVAFAGGGGTGAAATVVLGGQSVIDINLTNAGSGYTYPVTVTISGGGGTGATAVALFTGTSIASVTISNGGQFYTTAPAVQVLAGSNNAASATVTLSPYGVSGAAMETYLSRVWIVNPALGQFSDTPPGGNFSVTAPGSITDFATSDGGVDALNTDSFLQTKYVNVRQSSGYLYFFGDGSINVVSNVSTSGSPTTTTYNYQNVDPQSGLDWRDALQDFSRSTILANQTGVYGLYGGAATKISEKLDNLFDIALFPPQNQGIQPTSAVATIYNIKHYLMLMTIMDPVTNQPRNIMVTWNEKDWVLSTQTIDFIRIQTEKKGSFYNAFGSEGLSIYPMFATPSSALVKRMDTKYYGATADKMFIQKESLGSWIMAQDQSTTQSGINGTFQIIGSGLALQPAATELSTFNEVWPAAIWAKPVAFNAPPPFYPLWGASADVKFTSMAIRFVTTSPDFTLVNWVIGYRDVTALF